MGGFFSPVDGIRREGRAASRQPFIGSPGAGGGCDTGGDPAMMEGRMGAGVFFWGGWGWRRRREGG